MKPFKVIGASIKEENKSIFICFRSILKCKLCNVISRTEMDYKYHLALHYNCNICGTLFQYKKEFKKHSSTHLTHPFKCHQCSKSFPKANGLNSHMQIHKLHAIYKCPRCSRTYIKLHKLKKHIDMKHYTFNYDIDIQTSEEIIFQDNMVVDAQLIDEKANDEINEEINEEMINGMEVNEEMDDMWDWNY